MKKTYFNEEYGFTVEVVESKRKDILDYLDNFISNMTECEGFEPQGECINIIYKDGSFDTIDEFYDGHKIKRTSIKSAVYYDGTNAYYVYGEYAIDSYGVVYNK